MFTNVEESLLVSKWAAVMRGLPSAKNAVEIGSDDAHTCSYCMTELGARRNTHRRTILSYSFATTFETTAF
jgi:hypothetical protein